MPINRGPFNALVDDDGSGTTGTPWNKAQIASVLLDPIDALTPGAAAGAAGQVQYNNGGAIAGAPAVSINAAGELVHSTGSLRLDGGGTIAPSTIAGNDSAAVGMIGGGAWGSARGAALIVAGNEAPQLGGILLIPGAPNGTVQILRGIDGYAVFTVTASGAISLGVGQVQFPGTGTFPSADTSTLDDYREGSWTPAVGGMSGQSGQTYNVQLGRFVKVGKLVFVQGWLALSSLGTITGQLVLTGLPFLAENFVESYGTLTFSYFSGLLSPVASMMALVRKGAVHAEMFMTPPAGTTALQPMTAGNIGGAFTVAFAGSYIANA